MSSIDTRSPMPDFLTTDEVAQVCHVSKRTVARWLASGLIRAQRIAGTRRLLVPRDALAAAIKGGGAQ